MNDLKSEMRKVMITDSLTIQRSTGTDRGDTVLSKWKKERSAEEMAPSRHTPLLFHRFPVRKTATALAVICYCIHHFFSPHVWSILLTTVESNFDPTLRQIAELNQR
uniref:Uncharacterized protein n=1 Tax=Setaria digitata TaxID=48799 RepID=A0A915PC08_9BILA